MEFMLETIFDIKNNKKTAKEDTIQHTRIKKWLQKLRVESILVRGLKWSKLLDPNKNGHGGYREIWYHLLSKILKMLPKRLIERARKLRKCFSLLLD